MDHVLWFKYTKKHQYNLSHPNVRIKLDGGSKKLLKDEKVCVPEYCQLIIMNSYTILCVMCSKSSTSDAS